MIKRAQDAVIKHIVKQRYKHFFDNLPPGTYRGLTKPSGPGMVIYAVEPWDDTVHSKDAGDIYIEVGESLNSFKPDKL